MKKFIFAVTFLSIFTIFTSQSFAAVPETFSHQGYLADSSGVPVDGTVSMTFSLYDVSTGGTPVWSEVMSAVPVAKGVYTVTLGFPNPFNLPFDVPYFLGVTVGGDPEMTPRTRLRSAPTAIRAGTADNADKIDGLTLVDLDTRYAAVQQVPRANTFAQIVSGSMTDSPSISIGGDSLPVIAFIDQGQNPPELKVAKCLTQDCTSVQISSHDTEAGGPVSLVIGVDGFPIISYFSGSKDTISVLKCGDNQCSTGQATKTALGIPGVRPTGIAIGIDGLPRLTTKDLSDFIVSIKCLDAACATNSYNIVQYAGINPPCTTGSPVSFSSATNVKGFSVISWVTDDYGLNYATCADQDCLIATYDMGTLHDSCAGLGDVFGTNSFLTIGADNYPVIALSSDHGVTSPVRRMHVIKFGNINNPAGGSVTVIDSHDGNQFDYPSITNGSDGFPVISYWDPDNGIKVAKCFDQACANSNIVTIDSGFTSLGTSITTATDGNPVIVYSQETPVPGLKLMKCSNPHCLNAWSLR